MCRVVKISDKGLFVTVIHDICLIFMYSNQCFKNWIKLIDGLFNLDLIKIDHGSIIYSFPKP